MPNGRHTERRYRRLQSAHRPPGTPDPRLAEAESHFAKAQSVLQDFIGSIEKTGGQTREEGKASYAAGLKAAFLLGFCCIVLGVFTASFIAFHIIRAIHSVQDAAKALALGDVEQEIVVYSKDEMGQMAAAFRTLIAYQKEMAEVAQAIAAGDLTHSVTPKSEKDVLGTAVNTMVGDLRTIISAVIDSTDSVSATSAQVAASITQTGYAANQISQTIQEVAQSATQAASTSQEMAQGSEQQARSATEATDAMSRLEQAVQSVQQGSQQQQVAIQQADQEMRQAASSVEEVAQSAQQAAATAQQAAQVAQQGGKSVEQTIASMSRIREQVEIFR